MDRLDSRSKAEEIARIQRRYRLTVISLGAFAVCGVFTFVLVGLFRDSSTASRNVLFWSMIWAVVGLWIPSIIVLDRLLHRWRVRRSGVDICPRCVSKRGLEPRDQHCPACGALRACSVCKHRIEAHQCACPECGRAVWGRVPRETDG
jgi:hypothetical protein